MGLMLEFRVRVKLRGRYEGEVVLRIGIKAWCGCETASR